MKKLIIFALLAVIVLGMSACTTYDKKPLMKDDIALSTETNSMWARPSEVAYEIIGDVEGTVEYSKLFGYLPLGDTPATSIASIFGTASNDVGARCAAYDAMKTVGADGIYVTSIYSSSTNNIILIKETVTVRGKALKLVDLGTVDQERADTVRYLKAAGGLDKTNIAPNLNADGVFGGLGSLFSFD